MCLVLRKISHGIPWMVELSKMAPYLVDRRLTAIYCLQHNFTHGYARVGDGARKSHAKTIFPKESIS